MKIQQKIEKQYNIPYPVTFPVDIISSSAFRIYNIFFVNKQFLLCYLFIHFHILVFVN